MIKSRERDIRLSQKRRRTWHQRCRFRLQYLARLGPARSSANRKEQNITSLKYCTSTSHRVRYLHTRAWELLVDAQRQSRDADIFRRVVDRIKVCVEEATSPSTPTVASPAASAPGVPTSRPGSPTQLPPMAPTDNASNSLRRKKKGRSGDGSGPAARARDVQCNWALAHAACRVCRVVGRTFQVAIRWVYVDGGCGTKRARLYKLLYYFEVFFYFSLGQERV